MSFTEAGSWCHITGLSSADSFLASVIKEEKTALAHIPLLPSVAKRRLIVGCGALRMSLNP